MTSAEAFADEVAQRVSSVLARTGSRQATFAIGELPFHLVAPHDNSVRWVGRAFLEAPIKGENAGAGLHRLAVWDGTDGDAPAPPWSATAPEPLGVVGSHSNDAVRCAVDIHTNALIVYDFRHNSSHTWYPSIAELPAWAKASPFRVGLSWLCNCRGMQIVHGAAVAIAGQAVLLAGKGGSGKSTTALACALAGMHYLGDDYCAVEPATGKVHMIYRTAKVFASALRLLPELADWIDNKNTLPAEKGVIFLQPGNVKLARSARLAAILLPHVRPGSATQLSPATRADAVNAILPSTIGGLMGGTSATPRLILELVRRAPAFHLALGDDLDGVIDAIAARLSGRKRCARL